MTSCIFCKILYREQPASIVYQDDLCTAFMNIQPVNEGHLLVIPNVHAAYLAALDDESGANMFLVAKRLAQALRDSSLNCEGVNFFLADGEAAFQEVFHVHLHVIPRYSGDGFGLTFGPHYSEKPDRSALDAAAEKIRNAF